MTATSPYRFGGWSGILVAASSLMATVLIVLIGAPPTDPEELLRYLSPSTAAWSIIVSLSVLAAVFVLPFAYALYKALRDAGGNLALAGCGLLALFALLDLTVRWPNYAALITLAEPWRDATTTEIQRLVGTAGQATAVLQSFLLPIYATVVPGIGILLVSVAWARADLGRLVAYVGMAVGALAVITLVTAIYVADPAVLMLVSSAAAALWFAVAGSALLRLDHA